MKRPFQFRSVQRDAQTDQLRIGSVVQAINTAVGSALKEREALRARVSVACDLASFAVGTGDDPDYRSGGSDSLMYRIPLAALKGNARPASVLATLYYQATPPFFLQDRFCTSKSEDTKRLYYLAGKLGLSGTQAENWKLRVVTSGPVSVP